jgi:phosphohistidine swiveling domain-containing protein
MQETWFFCQQDGIEKFVGKNPFAPINVYYLVDGAIEVWGNIKAIGWLKDRILQKNKSDKSFIDFAADSYKKACIPLKEAWKRGYCNTKKELIDFIKNSFIADLYFVLWYYSAMNDKTPKKIREKALRIRAKDTFFDDTDRTIRNSIKRLWPNTIGYENGIVSNEIYSDNIPPIGELKKRKSSCVRIPGKFFGACKIKDFLKNNNDFVFKYDLIPKKCSELKGTIAFRGLAKGLVRILKTKDSLNGFKEKEILVSPMTVPDFLSAIKKAAAIVTDEGGITSHAAIVAREMKKPCIIGTKNATRVFKDGDYVEVDANRGIVRLIKK